MGLVLINHFSYRLTIGGTLHMNRYKELQDLLATFEKDFEKFYDKENKSAGTRVRKAMNEIKKKAQEIRKEVQDMKTGDKAAA